MRPEQHIDPKEYQFKGVSPVDSRIKILRKKPESSGFLPTEEGSEADLLDQVMKEKIAEQAKTTKPQQVSRIAPPKTFSNKEQRMARRNVISRGPDRQASHLHGHR